MHQSGSDVDDRSTERFAHDALSASALGDFFQPVLMCTAEGDVVYANRRACDVTGYDGAELTSLSLAELMPEVAERVKAGALREEGAEMEMAGRLHRKDGTAVPCVLEGASIHHEGETLFCGCLHAEEERGATRTYRRLFEESQEGILISAPDGTILDANPSVCALTGYSREELLGREAAALYTDAEERDRLMRTLRAEGEVHGWEVSLSRKEGPEMICQVSATMWRTEGGEEEAVQTFIRDVTEHQRRAERFTLLVKEVKEYAIFTLDAEGYVTSWNEGARRIKGYTEDEVIGVHFSTFYPPEAREAGRPSEVLATAREEGQWTGEGWRMRKDGRRFRAHVTVTALYGEDDTVRGFSKVTRDMTERYRRERELERQQKQAREAEERARKENALLRLMQAMVTTANDADTLDDAVRQVMGIVCEHIDWPVGHVYWVHEDREPALASSGIWDVREDGRYDSFRAAREATSLALGEGLPGRAVAAEAPIWCRDVTQAAYVHRDVAEEDGLQGAFAVPLFLDGTPVAVLEFFATQPKEEDDELMEAMASVGQQLSRVAERERTQKRLRRSEQRYRRLFETSQEGIVIQAADGTITDVNPAALQILGYERDELIGSRPTPFFAVPHQRWEVLRTIEEKGQLRNEEVTLRRKGGDVIVCEATATLQREAEDTSEAIFTIFRDITERKRVQEALRESEKKFRALAESTPVGIGWVQEDGYRYVNPAYADILGYEREEMIGESPERFFHPADWPMVENHIRQQLAEEEGTVHYQARMQTKDGETRYVEIHATQISYQGKPTILGTVQDVTERRQLQEELLQVQDEERQRLGQELHDGVGSLLTAGVLQVSTAAEEMRAGESVDPGDLDRAVEYLKQAANEARAISHGLSPVGLERGLLSALEELASQTELRGEVGCSFEVEGPIPEIEEETATHLYRIAQEAANNAVKHAEADQIRLRIESEDDVLCLAVEDDGKGYDDFSLEGDGLGMRTMRYRANLIDGTLTVEQAPEGGTIVRCRIPPSERS